MHLLRWDVLEGQEDELEIRLEQDCLVSDYAILSHRWGPPADEVLFDDMIAGREKNKKGYAKLYGSCQQARKDGLRHVWIDTCCINKASSAELSEAITSMFAYYERSKVCYVYLNDVSEEIAGENFGLSSFLKSEWFTRGWTLQELIAPKQVKFFNFLWLFLGYKTDDFLTSIIEGITGIDSTVLHVPATLPSFSIAKRMSWIARRKTTRVEDMAYSLMGIFGVFMPPLYGEGAHAFIRLQEEIMKHSNDHTIFAWTSPPRLPLSGGYQQVSTMLALSPDQFEDSSDYRALSFEKHSVVAAAEGRKMDYTVTNSGIAIRLPIRQVEEVEGLYVAFLACSEGPFEKIEEIEGRIPSAIFLSRGRSTPPNHFWRTNSNEGPIERSDWHWFSISGRMLVDFVDIYILPRFTPASAQSIEPSWSPSFAFNKAPTKSGHLLWKKRTNILSINPNVLKHLHHVRDPSFHELDALRVSYNLISTDRGKFLVDHVRQRWHFPKLIPNRVEEFTGRVDVLKELSDMFKLFNKEMMTKGGVPRLHTISGPKNIGKTQLANQFCHLGIETHIFQAVLWIHASTLDSCYKDFRKVADGLDLPTDRLLEKEVVSKVLSYLSEFDQHKNVIGGRSEIRSARWLLVFESVEDSSLLKPFLPSHGHGSVLIITRNNRIPLELGCQNTTLQPLTVMESYQLLTRLTYRKWDFTEASERLGGCPYKIKVFANVIWRKNVYQNDLLGLLDELRFEEPPSEGEWDDSSNDQTSTSSMKIGNLVGIENASKIKRKKKMFYPFFDKSDLAHQLN